MKRLLFALLLVSSAAHADSQLSLRSNGLKFDSGTTPPSNCTTGTLCLWRNGNTLTLRTTSNTDLVVATGSSFVTSVATSSPLSGTITSTGTLSCPTCAVTTTTITASTGLTGGGDLSANRTLAIDTSVVPRIATANTFTKSQNTASVALTDATSIATDASLGNVFTVTLGGNRTLANPTNLVAGGTYIWIITQDGSGSHTLAYGNLFAWPTATAPTLSATAAYVDLITAVYDGTKLRAVFTGDLR